MEVDFAFTDVCLKTISQVTHIRLSIEYEHTFFKRECHCKAAGGTESLFPTNAVWVKYPVSG